MSKASKRRLRDETDRAVALADTVIGAQGRPTNVSRSGKGSYSVDQPRLPRIPGSVEPGAPAATDRIPVIPTASVDPVRVEGNWAPFRPAAPPIPDLVPGFDPNQPLMNVSQWGGTGTPITAGFLQDLGEYNPELYGRNAVQIYEKMRRGDGQVWATLSAVKSPLRSAKWAVQPGVKPNDPGYAKAKEVAEFVEDNLFGGLEFTTSTGGRHTQQWDQVLWNALLMLDFGCAVHEDVYAVDGNHLRLRSLVPLLPITFYRWHVEVDGFTLIALEQYGYRGIEFINATVPAEKLCRFTLHQEGSNFWGISMLRPLDLDTEIPGPDGWRTIREIEPGHRVFDETGKIRHVVRKTPTYHDRPSYRLTFSSGHSIVADEDHNWITQTAKERDNRLPGQLRTTKQIVESLKQPGSKRSNHSIQLAEPVEYAPQLGLPIHPYLLGLWLGDGDSRTGRVSCHKDEVESKLQILSSLGYKCTSAPSGKPGGNGAEIKFAPSAFGQKILGVHDLFRNKHIPEAYLRGSIEQRRALLAGLMDSDGTCNDQGQCSFANCNRGLIASIMELLASLGELPRLVENRKKKNQKLWEVRFTTQRNPFWAGLKKGRIKKSTRWTRARHYVVKAERVEPRDVACIEVDGPSHMFLAGRGFIPTHNSAYPHWYIKNQLYRVDAIAGERNGLGVPTIEMQPSPSSQDVANAMSYVTKLAANEMTGIVLPNGAKFSITGVTGQPRNLQPSIEHHNRMITSVALAMFMSIGSAPHGSRATAATQHDFFLASSQHLSDYLAEQISNTTISRLVRFNFGEDAIVPKLRATNLKMRDFEDIRQALQQLAAAGLVVSDMPLRKYIREEYELPDETDEGVLSIKNETIETTPAEQAQGMPEQIGGKTPPLPAQPTPGAAGGGKQPLSPPNKSQGQRPLQRKGVTGANGTAKPVNDTVQASQVLLADEPARKPITPTIYFVRHGETPDDAIEPEVISSWREVPLDAKGLSEAKAAGAALADKNVAEIYASDLRRTMETAEQVQAATGAPIFEERGLRGWNVGEWSGHEVTEVLDSGLTIAQTLTMLQENPTEKPPGGESWAQCQARLADCLAWVVRRAEQLAPMGQAVAVVTHSRVINTIPTLSSGGVQEKSETDGAGLGRVSIAQKRKRAQGWWIAYNSLTLSDVEVIPNNRSGQPTQRSTTDALPPGAPADTAQESAAARQQPSPSIGGYAPNRKQTKVPPTPDDVTSALGKEGARIVHPSDADRKATMSFKPSASQEGQVSWVPEELQPPERPSGLNPTPLPKPAQETFADRRPPRTQVKPSAAHFGKALLDDLKATQAHGTLAVNKIVTGALKAKIIAAIAKQAAPQLKAGVAPDKLVFTPPVGLEKLLQPAVDEVFEHAANIGREELEEQIERTKRK